MREPDKVSMFSTEVGIISLNVLMQRHNILQWSRWWRQNIIKGIQLNWKVKSEVWQRRDTTKSYNLALLTYETCPFFLIFLTRELFEEQRSRLRRHRTNITTSPCDFPQAHYDNSVINWRMGLALMIVCKWALVVWATLQEAPTYSAYWSEASHGALIHSWISLENCSRCQGGEHALNSKHCHCGML